jgi:hypothetical protein
MRNILNHRRAELRAERIHEELEEDECDNREDGEMNDVDGKSGGGGGGGGGREQRKKFEREDGFNVTPLTDSALLYCCLRQQVFLGMKGNM